MKIFALEGFQFNRFALLNEHHQKQAEATGPQAQLFLDVSGLKEGHYQYLVRAHNQDGYLCYSRPFSIRVPFKERIEYPPQD